MAIGRLTNRGRAVFAAHDFNGVSLGLENNGSAVPSFWAVLHTNTVNIYTTGSVPNNGVNPVYGTIQHIQTNHVGAIILPNDGIPSPNYNEHDIPQGTFTITQDDVTNLARITFAVGQEPLLTVTNPAGLASVGGWLLCTKKNPLAADDVLGAFPALVPLVNTPLSYRIRIRDLEIFSQAI